MAHTGPEGLLTARAFDPDVVLCDIGLPGMDGYDVARAFRGDQALAGLSLIALTGYAREGDIERAREVGFDWHVAKPPDFDRLEAVVQEAAERRATRTGGPDVIRS